jgi:hypothetical protein
MKKVQSHDDALRMTSLQLVGKASCASSRLVSSMHTSDMPWDEADRQSTEQSCESKDQNSTMNDHTPISFDQLSKPDESRWRAHGAARRQKLLDDDQAKGGRTFQLKFETSVHRYFSVAHWALEQFHHLYQSGKDLEETYVMGYRIVSFLTECLPHHPGLRSAPDIRQRARAELELLRKCLEDVALHIDEETCNTFVDDFDPLFVVGDVEDDDDDSITETTPSSKLVESPSASSRSSKKSRMVRFEDWEDFPEDEKDWQRKSAESPSAETVGTTGTSSLEPTDLGYLSTFSREQDSSEDDGSPLRQHSIERRPRLELDSSDEAYEMDCDDEEEELSAAFPSLHNHYFHRHVRLDFLEQIASEEVQYETDSEAADSWAQTPDDIHPTAPSSSGVSPTCDPARIAFRNLMNRLPQQPILENLKASHELRRSARKTRSVGTEQQIEDEIRRFLDSEEGGDAQGVVESCQEKLKEPIVPPTRSRTLDCPTKVTPPGKGPSASSSSFGSSEYSLQQREDASAFHPYSRRMDSSKAATKNSRKSLFEKNFLDDNDWISFDASNSQVVNFFATN